MNGQAVCICQKNKVVEGERFVLELLDTTQNLIVRDVLLHNPLVLFGEDSLEPLRDDGRFGRGPQNPNIGCAPTIVFSEVVVV